MKFYSDYKNIFPLLIATTGSFIVTPPYSFAQGNVLEEVLVTARKREESLQEFVSHFEKQSLSINKSTPRKRHPMIVLAARGLMAATAAA